MPFAELRLTTGGTESNSEMALIIIKIIGAILELLSVLGSKS